MAKRKFLLYILPLLLIITAVFVTVKDDPWQNACFKDHCFNIEPADTSQERIKGLAGRDNLGLNSGMFFEFDNEGQHSFWMKGVTFPLDMIWINKNKEVVCVKKHIQPCRGEICEIIQPDEKAKYVLEINAGLADKINIREGDKIALFK